MATEQDDVKKEEQPLDTTNEGGDEEVCYVQFWTFEFGRAFSVNALTR